MASEKRARTRRAKVPFLALGLLLMMDGQPACAHALVLASTPAAGAVVAGPEIGVEIRFSSRIDRKRSLVSVMLPNGTTRPVVLAEAGPPDSLSGKVGGLPAGQARLHWEVLSVDGHISRGDIPFQVRER